MAQDKIREAVSKVLAKDKWPICRTYDDNGLSERQYVEFCKEVIERLSPSHCTAGRREEIADETFVIDNPDGSISLDAYAGQSREQLKERCGELIHIVSEWQFHAMRAATDGSNTIENVGEPHRSEISRLIAAYSDDDEPAALSEQSGPTAGRDLSESNYCAGLTAGWNFGLGEDRDGLNAALEAHGPTGIPSPPDRQQDQDETSGLPRGASAELVAETEQQFEERLARQEAADNLRLLDYIAHKIGLPLDIELSRENFNEWLSDYASPPVSDAGREALRPFASFGLSEDGKDIRDGLMRDRICDWFGPSDFDAARNSFDKAGDASDGK